MDLPTLLAAQTARGGDSDGGDGDGDSQHGGGPGGLRRGQGGPPLGADAARRRLLVLRGPEDEGPGPSPPPPPPPGDAAGGDGGGGGGDSIVVLLQVALGAGAAAEDPGRPEGDPGPAGRPEQGLSGAATATATATAATALTGTVTIHNQDLLLRFDPGVFTLAAAATAPPAPGPPPPRPAEGRRGAPSSATATATTTPGYRCPEPQCALAFAKKHQLKVHLLSHGGSLARRPFKCPLEGCGWAFTTSYKLKRHLQAHDKLRPFGCPAGGCGKKFTTVYNLKAHMKGHEQEGTFKCEVCGERFPTHARLSTHQRSHFEPERPYKCDFPGCEKTFITVSALFSHNRAHFREQECFSCSFPGCNKRYDKACRLKVHLRSHTGERPFICDSDSCGWTFTSMSKLLRHKRKHDDDRRFTCPVEGCGKSFTRAEHLKGHSITHLGTKPFQCPVQGCRARFSARSSLYIHSKKHVQDVAAPKSRCPASGCSRVFRSKHSLKAHVVREHSRRQDLLPQLEAPSPPLPAGDLGGPGQSELASIDLAALFSDAPAVGGGGGDGSAGTSDEALNSGILTIDVTSVSSSLGRDDAASGGPAGQMDPLVLVAHGDLPASLDGPLILGTAASVLQQVRASVEDAAVTAGTLGCLVALPVNNLAQEPPPPVTSGDGSAAVAHGAAPASVGSPRAGGSVPTLLAAVKVEPDSPPGPGAAGPGWQDGAPGLSPAVSPGPAAAAAEEGHGGPREAELTVATGGLYLDSGASAGSDCQAAQLDQEKKQRGSHSAAGASESPEGTVTDGRIGPPQVHACSGGLPVPGAVAATAGAPCAGMSLLQDEPSGDGVLPVPSLQLPEVTVDLPLYVLQDLLPEAAAVFPGSAVALPDLQ
ncbi:LOW QUALITY PROTEIN: zinc finger protein ZXDC [Eulemur rufifrons]|uniref:LOW QUALITY PROTEIN: zinc finger protein ZXDC n=1 Tax=Eulemur rufifrons TaxID=859984 RepID=UPI0037444AC6